MTIVQHCPGGLTGYEPGAVTFARQLRFRYACAATVLAFEMPHDLSFSGGPVCSISKL